MLVQKSACLAALQAGARFSAPWSAALTAAPLRLPKVAILIARKGDYSEAYIKRHPGAPPSVQWQAGVVVKKGSAVDTNVWSSRANW